MSVDSDYDDTKYDPDDEIISFYETSFDESIESYNFILEKKDQKYKKEYTEKFNKYSVEKTIFFYICIFVDIIIFGDKNDKQFFGVIYKNRIYFSNRLSETIKFVLDNTGKFTYNEAGCSCEDCIQVMLDIYCRRCEIEPITYERFIDEMKYLLLYF